MATVLLALVVADAHSYAPDRTPATKDAQTLVHHRHRARVLIAEAHSLERWRDPTPAKAAEKRAWQAHRQAIRHKPTRRQISVYRERMVRRFERYREAQLELESLTPYGEWAIPEYVVMCESGGDYRARNSSSTAGGAYQIIDSTWVAYGGTDYEPETHPAAVAPPLEQHRVAGRIWTQAGPSQWECA